MCIYLKNEEHFEKYSQLSKFCMETFCYIIFPTEKPFEFVAAHI